jgi:hypothetical protein
MMRMGRLYLIDRLHDVENILRILESALASMMIITGTTGFTTATHTERCCGLGHLGLLALSTVRETAHSGR